MIAADTHRVQHSRAEVRALLLLRPHEVPSAAVSPDGFSALDWRGLRRLADAALLCKPGQQALTDVVAQGLAHLPLPGHADALGQLRCCLDDKDPHDAYFRVGRTPCLPGVGYVRGIVTALAVQIDEAVQVDEAVSYGVLPRALTQLWCDALGVPVSDAERHDAMVPPQASARPPFRRLAPDPVRRWVRGHQVFAVLTQGLIWSFHRLADAAANGPDADVVRALGRVRLMLDASAAGFRFASDFDPVHYTDTIRPSMSEPHVPKGFSGTLSSDHGHLVNLMSRMRPVLAQLQQRHPGPYAAMTQALGALYEDHKFVCERFDGAAKGSLRSEGKAGGHSGVEMLDRFKTQRMKMVG